MAYEKIVSVPSSSTEGQIATADGSGGYSWEDVEEASLLGIDSTPTASSTNLVTSGGVYTAVSGKSVVSVSSTGTSTDKVNYITVDGTEKKLGGTEVSVSASGTATDEVKYITIDGIEKKLAGGLPSVTSSDNGDVLQVVNGAWTKNDTEVVTLVDVPSVPSTTSLLKGNGSGGISAATAGTDYAAASHTQSASTISGGTFTGAVVAQNNTSYTTKQVRNITLSTADPASGSSAENGDIWIKYKE